MNIIERAKGILLQPTITWKEIAQEEGGLKEAFVPYAVIIQLIPAVAILFSGMGYGTMFSTMGSGADRTNPIGSVGSALITYVEGLLLILIVGKLMELFAPMFGGKKSWVLSCRVLIYSATAECVASLIAVIPILGAPVTLIALLWSLVLLYMGIGSVLGIHGAKQLFFLIGTLIGYGLCMRLLLLLHPS